MSIFKKEGYLFIQPVLYSVQIIFKANYNLSIIFKSLVLVTMVSWEANTDVSGWRQILVSLSSTEKFIEITRLLHSVFDFTILSKNVRFRLRIPASCFFLKLELYNLGSGNSGN